MPIITPPKRENRAVTTASGLILPPRYAGTELARHDEETGDLALRLSENMWSQQAQGFNTGYQLTRDGGTHIICWPQKGSGIDDWTMGEIIDGNIANAGIAPVVSSLLSSAVQIQIAQAANADITLTGRKSPTKKARDAISRWNDSPTGAINGLTEMVYKLLVYNRGAPVATVPIMYPFEQWQEYGMQAVPMVAQGENENEAKYFWLEVDWPTLGPAIPYLPSPFDLESTGNNEWPYWYRVTVDKKERWVLLHNSQIIPVLPGHSQHRGIGTCSAWLSTEQLSFYIIGQDGKAEQVVNAPTTGFLAISGYEESTPVEVKQKIIDERKRQKASGNWFDKAPTILMSKDKISFDSFSFRDMSVWDEKEIARFEDRVATAFRMSLNQLGISRTGVGYAAQSEMTRDQMADSGIGYLLSMIGSTLGSIYPRVSISINRPNDYARVRQIADFKSLAEGISKLPADTLSKPQIIALIENLVGLRIPDVDETVTTSPGSDDTTDVAPTDNTGTEDGTAQDQPADQTQNEALHRAIDAMLLEAYSLLRFAPVEDVLAGDDGQTLFSGWFAGLQKQYKSADIARIVTAIRKKEIETDDPQFVEKVAPIVQRYTKKLKTTLDRAATIAALLAIALQGRLEAEDQARQAEQDQLTTAQRKDVDNATEADMNERLDQLLVKATGQPAEDDRQDIEDQTAENTLDVHSYEVIAALIWSVMLDNIEIPAIKAAYLALVPEAATTRAELITDIEGSRAYSNSFSRAADPLRATDKEWLMTTSINPREKHLAIVGEIVPIGKRFSSGDNWAGELWGCKCGIRLIWR